MKKSLVILSFSLITFLCLRCSEPVSGNGTQTGNAAVAGVLYESDGTTPAAGVRVSIRPRNTLADTSKTRTRAAFDTASTITDAAGQFSFDTTLKTGIYVIEAIDGDDAVLIDSVSIINKDTTDTLPPDTLKPVGAIKGIIKLAEGGDPRKVFVLAFGIDRFARVETDGSFRFNNLAEAKYDLRLIASLDNYGVLDTTGINVVSGDTTDLGTIEMPFEGIPVPKNVRIDYDTLKQIVTLTWNKADTTLVKSYNIYRRNVDSNTVALLINNSTVADTVYRDSTGVQGQTYEYKVTALDKQGNEGEFGNGASVKVVAGYFLANTIGTNGINYDQLYMPQNAISKNGDYLIIDVVSPYPSEVKAKIFSQTGTYSGSFSVRKNSSADLIYGMSSAFDAQNNLVVCFKDSTFKFDTSGNLLDKYKIEFTTIGPHSAYISTSDSILIYVINPDRREIFAKNSNNDTALKFSMPNVSVDLTGLTVDTLGNIYVGDIGGKKILKYNSNGSLLMEIGPNSNNAFIFSRIQCILVDTKGRIIVDDSNRSKIFIFDDQGKFLCQFEAFINTKIWQGTVNDNSAHLNMFFSLEGNICLLEGNSYKSVFVFKPSTSSF